MKKIFVLTILFCIFIFGCGKKNIVNSAELVPPMPNFKHPNSNTQMIKASNFSCLKNPEVAVGRVYLFFAQPPDSSQKKLYSKWIFYTNDSIISRLNPLDGELEEVWYDFGNDLIAEYYFSNYEEIPNRPDICNGLEFLKENK